MKAPVVSLPEGLLVSWYGDDFTGSSAVMEVLSLAGLPSVLFLDIPTPELLAKFAGYRGMGIAGVARSQTPAWMSGNLPAIFRVLAQWRAPITHYKVCSTFDSAPHVGSVGKAIDVAQSYFRGSRWIPLVIAAPAIKRYQIFGNLFVGPVATRLDRYTPMINHPVTPMTEADVRAHLSKQTEMPIGLIDYLAVRENRAEEALQDELAKGHRIIAIDALDEESLAAVGRLVWQQRGEGVFATGSQGLEYALVAFWRQDGVLPEASRPRAAVADRIAIVSGSCSAVTEEQISWGERNGFKLIRIDARKAVDECAWEGEVANATRMALAAIDEDRDPIVFAARGPDDPSIKAVDEAATTAGVDRGDVNATIGKGLGRILQSIFRCSRVRRGIIAGGDTSGHGTKMLGIEALTLAASTVPGAALFRAHSRDPAMAELELALKGGQMGTPDYFGQIKRGGVA